MTYDFRIDVLRNRAKIGEVNATKVQIDVDESKSVMKSIQLDMHDVVITQSGITFDMFKDRLRPVLIIDETEYPLGIYMIVAAPKKIAETGSYYEVEAYDETMIVKQASFETRQFYASGTTYLQIIQSILTSLGLIDIYYEASTATTSEDLEIAPGENCLERINDMLDAMNFQHIFADANGTIVLRKAKNPTSPDFIYRDKKDFKIIEGLQVNTDIYDLPNVVIGVYSSPSQNTPIVYKKVNNDPNSIISTVNRGYNVVKTISLWSSATAQNLKDYVDRVAFDAMQATETVTFSTAAEGGHEPSSAVQIDTEEVSGLFVEKAWSMSISSGSFEMQHVAERKVFV